MQRDLVVAARDSDARIADNAILDGGIGVILRNGSTVLEGNRKDGDVVGLSVQTRDTTTSLTGNTTCGNETNLRVNDGAAMPELRATRCAPTAPDGMTGHCC